MERIAKITRKNRLMTISFFEQGDVPQPPDKTKIEHLTATPSEDGWRVKVEIHVTPFQVRPSIEVALLNTADVEKAVANFSIVETMQPKMEFTLHIRRVDDPKGDYVVKAMLYYRDAPEENAESLAPMQVKDQKEFQFTIGTRE